MSEFRPIIDNGKEVVAIIRAISDIAHIRLENIRVQNNGQTWILSAHRESSVTLAEGDPHDIVDALRALRDIADELLDAYIGDDSD